MVKVLIIGIFGQDGVFLVCGLFDQGYEVYGVMCCGSMFKIGWFNELGICEKIKYCMLEVIEFVNVQNVLNEICFDYIYNLVVQSFVVDSFQFLYYMFDVNYMGVFNIFEVLCILKLDLKLYQVFILEMYGDVLEKLQMEKILFNLFSFYVVFKFGVYLLVVNYCQVYDMFVILGILFNYEFELCGLEFVICKIISWFVEIKLQGKDVMFFGNFSSVWDWGYVFEYIDMMIKMLEYDELDDFVIFINMEYIVWDFFFMVVQEVGFDLYLEGEGIEEKCYDCKIGKLVVYVDL